MSAILKHFPWFKQHVAPPPAKCGSSIVEARQDAMINGHAHAGSFAHVCDLPPNHPKDPSTGKAMCRCKCGHQWLRWL